MNTPGFNGTRQIVAIPANGAGVAQVLATGPVRYVEVVESTLTPAAAANTPQGFQYQLPNDNFTTWLPILPPTAAQANAPPNMLQIGDQQSRNDRFGILLGNGPDTPGAGAPPIPATVLFTARSATATATYLTVTQYY